MPVLAVGHLRIPCPRFVGREAELLWLQERLEEARRGRGDFVLLAGEAGIGKSRLVAELTLRARAAEAQILEGKCSILETALPYGPLSEALRGLLHARDPASTAALLGPHHSEIVKLLPELSTLLPEVDPRPPIGPLEERTKLFESLYLVFRRIAADAPLILVLEDLHWADPATLEFLLTLSRRLPHDRWLVLATYRPEELERAVGFRRLRQELLRERVAQELALRPLGLDDTGTLVDAVLGPLAPPPEPFVGWLHNYGEGNPFFTEEILRAIVASNDAHLLRIDVAALETMVVAPTVREAILDGIGQLPAETRGLLAAAAALGRTFDLDALQRVTGLAGDALTRAFLPLLSLQLLRADQIPLRYTFRHHLIREVMLQSLAPDHRRKLHRAVGEYLEGSGAPPRVLTFHFQQAGDRERTLRYSLAAAHDASSVWAHEDAARLYAAALEVMPPAGAAQQRVAAAEGWGDALFHNGQLTEAIQAYTLMRQTADEAGLRRETIRALRKLGRTQNEQSEGSGLASFEQALALLAKEPDPAEEAMVREQVSKVAFITGQYDRSIAEAEAALAAATRAGDAAGQSRAYKSLAVTLQAQGRPEKVREYLSRARDLAVEAGDVEAELKALNDLGIVAMSEASFEGARIALERGVALIEKTGFIPTLMLPMHNLARLSFWEGRWDDAERLFRKMTTVLAERHGRTWPFALGAAYLALVRFLRGDEEEAAALLDQAQGPAEATSDAWSLTIIDGVRAQIALRHGDPSPARAALDGALHRSGVPSWTARDIRLLLAEALIASGELPKASDEVRTVLESRPDPLLLPRILRLQGRIAAQEGRLVDAVQAYHAGLNALLQARQPYQEALLRYDLGLCLLRRGGRGDRKEARAHLLSAAAAFEGLGAEPDAAEARKAIRRISGRRPSGATLTEREREVLTLIAEGLTNAAIGARLYISERTVEVHVRHIFGKLGIESRAQAAAWAARHLPSAPSASA